MNSEDAPAPTGPAPRGIYRDQALYHYEQGGFENSTGRRAAQPVVGLGGTLSLYLVSLLLLAAAVFVLAQAREPVPGSLPALVRPEPQRGVVRVVAVFHQAAEARVRAGTSVKLRVAGVDWSVAISGKGGVVGRAEVISAYPELSASTIPERAVIGSGTLPAAALPAMRLGRLVRVTGVDDERYVLDSSLLEWMRWRS